MNAAERDELVHYIVKAMLHVQEALEHHGHVEKVLVKRVYSTEVVAAVQAIPNMVADAQPADGYPGFDELAIRNGGDGWKDE